MKCGYQCSGFFNPVDIVKPSAALSLPSETLPLLHRLLWEHFVPGALYLCLTTYR
uniref:Uncharacterized protein n=1 Tax=Physcomitrium patens TaxID=3218 RepID=A0A2K1IHH9_PHYPA|nr:hypothetical protein PHYPA_029325 [Physcomitrium patens]